MASKQIGVSDEVQGDPMELKEVNWTALPDDNLCLIFEKLIAHSDFLQFLAVCKTWRVAVLEKLNNYIRKRIESCSNQVPLLMVRSPETNPNLYSLTSRSVISSQPLSVPYNFRCSGSSYGWLAFATGTQIEGKRYSFEIILYNPFNGQKINDLPHMEKRLENRFPHYFVMKVILSANPCANPDDFYIVAIYGGMSQLALLKYGQKFWTYIDLEEEVELVSSDVLFFQGLLYAVTNWGKIATIDIINCLNKKEQEVPQPIFILPTEENRCSRAEYLVESSQGDLFVVRIFFNFDELVKSNFRFEVHKVVIPGDKKAAKLEEVKSLGNDALFVGDNHSMSVSILEFPECRPDSIYFTDDIDYNPDFYDDYGPQYHGIYNLKSGDIQQHYQPHPEEEKHMLPPIWIIPTPKIYYGLDDCNKIVP